MEVNVKNGKLVYSTERPKETCCEYYAGGVQSNHAGDMQEMPLCPSGHVIQGSLA